MAKLLVYDKDNFHTDSEKEYRGCYKKGYIVEVHEDTKPHVSPLQPPFLILQITDRTKAQVEQYMYQWDRVADYAVIARDVPLDGWRLDLVTINPNPSGKGHITQVMVQGYLEGWGATIIGMSGNAVRFDITIGAILRSGHFWGANVGLIVFNELSYDEGTGVHRTEANYGAVPVPPKTTLDTFEAGFARRVEEVEGTVISNTGGVIVFDIGRDAVIQRVRDEVKLSVADVICRRKVYLDPAYADTIIAAGRELVATAAEVAPFIRDRETE